MNYDDVDVPAESRQAWDAISAGDLQTVERWLDTGVNPSAPLVPGNETTAPLFLALAPGGMMHDEPTQLDVIRLLVSRGADINCSFTLDVMPGLGDDEMKQFTLLTIAIGLRREPASLLLLMELGVDLEHPNGISQAFYSGPDVLEKVLRGGALLDGPAWPPILRMPPEELGELLGVHEDLIAGAAATAMNDITGEEVDAETVGEIYADSRLLCMRSARFLIDVRAAGGWKRVRSAEFLRSYATAVNYSNSDCSTHRRYALRGHKQMLVLRELGHRGRATVSPRTPSVVSRLFAAAPSSGPVDAQRRTRRARALEVSRTPLPAPLFFNVLKFWLGTPYYPWVPRERVAI